MVTLIENDSWKLQPHKTDENYTTLEGKGEVLWD